MVTTPDDGPLPFSVLGGVPSVVNLLDALQGWQLVRAASTALRAPVAASMKHVSPAGVAAAGRIDPITAVMFGLDAPPSGLASAYARARSCDPRSSYGDMVAVSHPVDLATARILVRVVSDGVIAPDFEPGVVGILARKKHGAFLILQMDPDHVPPEQEARDVFGVRIVQATDPITIDERTLGKAAETLPEALRKDVLLGLITVRHAQSNSVAYVSDGSTIGVGAGQQSRVDCVKLAGEKADRWRLLRHPRLAATRFPSGMSIQDRVNASIRLAEGELSETEKQQWLAAAAPCTVVSDAYFPFRDNVDVAARHGACCIVEGGGSRRSEEIEEACREHNIALIRTGLRLFCH